VQPEIWNRNPGHEEVGVALSLQRELETVAAAGGKVFATNKEAVLDEMPGA
jgi:hypothetical protein